MIKKQHKNSILSLLKNIKLSYNEISVLKDFSLNVPYQKITCIVGPSGCGKTSILNIIAGIVNDFEGVRDMSSRRIGYVFQEDRLLPWETVYKNVQLVRNDDNKDEIMALLDDLELSEFKDKYPHQLSGGMRQRCALARGFYYDGSLLLMDEPFKSLDYDLRLNMVTYLRRVWDHNQSTVIFVTHDIDEALLLGHQVIVLSKRPTRILETYEVNEPFESRVVMSDQHVMMRSQIIKHMTN